MPQGWKVTLHYKRFIPYILIPVVSIFPGKIIQADGDTPDKVRVVVIDPGHGGMDPGALGKNSREKDITLAIALKVGKYIEENIEDVKVIYTRSKDEFIELYNRATIANQNNADLFISVHANWWKKSNIDGAETYALGADKDESNLQVAMKENSVITLEEDYSAQYEGFDPTSAESYIIFNLLQSTYLSQSLSFASFVQEQFRERAKRNDRGVKQAGFLVLWRTTMPSVLIETGYISNALEEKYLMSEEGQSVIASAIYRAFKDYKSTIEDRSNFESSIQNVKKVKDNSTGDNSSNVVFMVQITSGTNSVPLNSQLFEGLESVTEFKADNYFKYATGNNLSYSEAAELRNKIKTRFKDAFIIAVKDGEIIPMKDAILLNND
jgi:N-acetylmuramoyl-L-alanine amidase